MSVQRSEHWRSPLLAAPGSLDKRTGIPACSNSDRCCDDAYDVALDERLPRALALIVAVAHAACAFGPASFGLVRQFSYYRLGFRRSSEARFYSVKTD